jgi:hypothetical protein
MSERYDVNRIAGFSALLFGSLLIFQMICQRLVGANVYADTGWPALFSRIVEHKSLYALSAAAGAVAAACTVPLVLGYWYSLEKEDAPLTFIASAFLLFSTLILVAAFAQYGNLVGTSFDYVNNVVPNYVAIEAGDSMGDQFQILQYAGFASFGFGLLLFCLLMSHSDFFPRPVIWLSAFVGMSALFSTVFPLAFVVGRITWAFCLGVAWLRGPVTEIAPESESVTAY